MGKNYIDGLFMAAVEPDEIYQADKVIDKMATGGLSGILPKVYKKEDLDKIKEAKDKKKEEALKGRMFGKTAAAALAAATYRTVEYALSGRKYIKLAGLNGMRVAMHGRGRAMVGALKKNKKR
ncbi:MAG: hypothetical protein MJZ17_05330 [Bacteroidales bacterium]|nr:hypothetical protein [Bacteroidales bacterium]